MTEGCTRGPWFFDGVCQIVEAARPHMRVCFLPSDHAEYASSEPNGYLIAASPDLLAFARAYDAFMAAHYSGPDSGALHPDAAYNWRMCRAAIARAEGSAP